MFFCFLFFSFVFFISIPLLNNIHIFWQLQPVLCGLFSILFAYQIDFKAAATKVKSKINLTEPNQSGFP